MTKDKAREILESVLTVGMLPIYDCVVYREVDQERGMLIEYTFRQLLCLVYNLENAE